MSDLPAALVRELTELFSVPVFPPDPRETPEAKAALQWNKSFNPNLDHDYEVELDYAFRLYKEAAEGFDHIDRKGDFLFKFAAGAIGVVPTLTKAMQINANGWAYIAFACFVLSFLFVVFAIYRARKASPIDVCHIVDFGTKPENFPTATEPQVKNLTRGFLAASAHVAIAEINAIVAWKSQQQARASWFLIFGLIFGTIWLTGG